MQNNYQNSINAALKELTATKSVSSGILVCNTVLEHMGIETKTVEDVELSKLKLPNAERYDHWFDAHPHFRGDRACFELTPNVDLLEAKFYALQKRSKLFIAGSVNFTPNFEDREYTRTDPSMKVGVDFFLTPEKDAVIVVLSNKGSIRLVELSGRLTNTQHEIFTVWHNVAQLADKNALHATIWESFKLSSLNEKFYDGITNSFTTLTQHLQTSGVEEQLANQFANRLLGRLLFIWFLRKKKIINESKEYFILSDQDDTTYYSEKLSYLFFNVLNTAVSERDRFQESKETLFGVEKKDPTLFIIDSETPYLNGGLFDQNSDGEYWITNKPTFPAGFFKALYDHFDSFNFTTDESTPEYEQIAIDPEMLGRIFESFLATLKTETGAQAKKANGAFYTPREIVSYMSRESLRQYLYTALDASASLKSSINELLDRPDSEWALAGTNSKRDTVAKEDRERIMGALRNIKVLDPAVGSGAFPMGMLHKMLSIFERLDPNFDSYEAKLSILRNNIYGVDIDPTAIEIARLRAWLSIIVDVKDIRKIKPLPNLDFKFVCANTLIGLTKGTASFTTDEKLKPTLMLIRDEYYATSSKTKKEKLQKEYLKLTHKESLFDTEETRQLKSYQPFKNAEIASFYDPELMHGVSAFSVLIGNPPYVQLQKFARTQIQKDLENQKFNTFTKNADLYCLFYEHAITLLKHKGVLVFITSNKWMRAGYGERLRSYFIENTNPLKLLDFGGFKVFESAAVDTSILMLEKAQNAHKLSAIHFKSDYKKGDDMGAYVAKRAMTLSNLNKSGWFIGNDLELSLKMKIEAIGMPLKDWGVKINRGIITGFNEAFIISKAQRDELIKSDPKSSELIKPILRGRDIKRYGYQFAELYMIVVKYGFASELKKYPAILKHLESHEEKLRARGQCNTSRNGKSGDGKIGETGQHHWLELDNNPNDEYLEQFKKEKVVWAETMRIHKTIKTRFPRFSIVAPAMYIDKTCFFFTSTRSKYLIGVLNSSVGSYLVHTYVDKLDTGGYMMQKAFVECLPIPESANVSCVKEIESLVDKILLLKNTDQNGGSTENLESQIDTLVYKLYELSDEEVKLIEQSQ